MITLGATGSVLSRNIALTGEIVYVIPTGTLSELNYLQYGGFVTFRF